VVTNVPPQAREGRLGREDAGLGDRPKPLPGRRRRVAGIRRRRATE
jgi:hypothetical protein